MCRMSFLERGFILLLLLFSLPVFSQTYLNRDSTVNARVEDLVQRMTLEEKVGQMTQVNWPDLDKVSDIKTFFIGSLLNGGGVVPDPNTAEAWVDKYNEFQVQAMSSRLGIPFIWGTDAVHGHNNLAGAVIFPHNIGLGCTRNERLIEEIGRITAIEVAATGVDWTFAPCIAVPGDERWGRTYEGFSENTELTGILGAAFIRGLQGSNLSDSTSILSCAKHFVGDGGTSGGKDQGDAEMRIEELRGIHMAPYIDAINAGTGSIMASYNSWNGEKLHGHKYLLTDVLKTELGFEGFIVSDWAAIDQLPGEYISDIEQSINAGIDMVMVPSQYKTFINGLISLVELGKVSMERIDDANRRILRMKFKLGLFEEPYAHKEFVSLTGCQEHREVGRQAVRESLVLLKNKNRILPLGKDIPHIHLAGKSADDLGNQCGGWSLSWQGQSGDITSGTTIWEGIRSRSTKKITYSPEGYSPEAEGADLAVVVIGETPYAEGKGDDDDLRLETADIEAVRSLYAKGIKVVTILISGRPMIIEDILHYSDAIIAAWLPGTEGQGVADILFGDYQPSGKLSFSWPSFMDQIPVNFGDNNYAPLYTYGYGLDTLALPGPDDKPLPLSAATSDDGNLIELCFTKAMKVPPLSSVQISINNGSTQLTGIALKEGDAFTLELSPIVPISAEDRVEVIISGGLEAADGSISDPFNLNVYNSAGRLNSLPGRIEAEDFVAASDVGTEQTSDEGGGLNVGWIDPGDYMDYTVYLSNPNVFMIRYRVASLSRGGRFKLQINEGEGFKDIHEVSFSSTGGWQSWITVEKLALLPAGSYTLRILSLSEGFNINWIEWVVATGISDQDENISDGFRVYPNPASDRFWFETEKDNQGVFVLYNATGGIAAGGSWAGSGEVDISGLPKGLYLLNIRTKKGKKYAKRILVR